MVHHHRLLLLQPATATRNSRLTIRENDYRRHYWRLFFSLLINSFLARALAYALAPINIF